MKHTLFFLLFAIHFSLFGQQRDSNQAITTSNSKAISFSISPNPSHDYLNIHLDSEKGNRLIIEVYNVLGKLVYTKSLDAVKESIPLDSWKKGVYVVLLKTNDHTQAKRFVKT